MRRTIPCLVTALLFCSCSSTPKRSVAEAPPPVYQPSPESTPIQIIASNIAAPKQSEVQEALKRVFKGAAVIETKFDPSFLAGDFNGDGSQDIAVFVKPANLDEMNEELQPWLVREPRKNRIERTRLTINKNESLLAIIHGYGANDWRDPEATQTFVLKDVVGSDLKLHSLKDFVTANSGRNLPRPQGDLISATVEGNPGYLYYAHSTYSWFDPKKSTGTESTQGVFHKSRPMR